MFEALHKEMTAEAFRHWPHETCGGIFEGENGPVYRRVVDVGDNTRAGFHIEPAVLDRLQEGGGKLLAIVRSHCSAMRDDPESLLFTPSAAEMRFQLFLALPFGVVVCDGVRCYEPFWFGDQCPVPPLLKRPFRHGITDCYSLIRDWFRLERGILLPEFPRDWNWWTEKDTDLYVQGFAQAGFRPIAAEDAREGDGVMFRMRANTPNHAAVVLGDGWMLHHPAARMPYDPLRVSYRQCMERWSRHATHWVRHESEM